MAKLKQSARTVPQLAQAIRAGRPLNIHRANFDSFDEIAIPLKRQKSWLLATLVSDDLFLNGYSLLRPSDITEISDSMSGFYAKVLKKRKLRVCDIPKLPAGSIRESLSVLSKLDYAVVSVHCESTEPDLVNVGVIDTVSQTHLTLRLVSPDAKLENLGKAIALKEITRIDFGGGYEEALSICLTSEVISV